MLFEFEYVCTGSSRPYYSTESTVSVELTGEEYERLRREEDWTADLDDIYQKVCNAIGEQEAEFFDPSEWFPDYEEEDEEDGDEEDGEGEDDGGEDEEEEHIPETVEEIRDFLFDAWDISVTYPIFDEDEEDGQTEDTPVDFTVTLAPEGIAETQVTVSVCVTNGEYWKLVSECHSGADTVTSENIVGRILDAVREKGAEGLTAEQVKDAIDGGRYSVAMPDEIGDEADIVYHEGEQKD